MYNVQSRNISSRMKIVFLLACVGLAVATPEYVTRKLCKDVDATQCTVHSVIVDPCAQGPAFCVVKKNKDYAVTLDMVPHFSASKLNLAIAADFDNSGVFTTPLKTPVDACSMLYCPLQAEERRIFDVNLLLDKRASVYVTNAMDVGFRRALNREFHYDYFWATAASRNLSPTPAGKFPVKVKMWNADNEAQACCVTFNVKVK